MIDPLMLACNFVMGVRITVINCCFQFHGHKIFMGWVSKKVPYKYFYFFNIHFLVKTIKIQLFINFIFCKLFKIPITAYLNQGAIPRYFNSS